MAESSTVGEASASAVKESPTKVSDGTLSVDAFHNFLQGKRHILVQDYAHAVLSLAKACELYVEHYGETAVECAEVYFYYGKALFRLFQQQAGILEDCLPEESPDDDEEEEEAEEGGEENENNESASEEDKEKATATEDTSNEEEGPGDEEDIGEESKEDSDSKDEPSVTKKDDKTTPDLAEEAKVDSSDNKVQNSSPNRAVDISDGVSSSKVDPAESSVEPTKDIATPSEVSSIEANGDIKSVATFSDQTLNDPSLSEPGPSKPKTEDEISDLQLAWETLETAKTIFKRHSDGKSESELRIAEILLILAEISLELENYAPAIEDLKECLEIRSLHLKPDDRHIAETFYQMALVYTFDNQLELAVDCYERSMDTIILRISILKKQTVIEQNADGFDIDPAIEISELESIIPDIKGKLDDTHEMIRDAKKAIHALAMQKLNEQKPDEGFADSSSSTSTAKPVSNITHLLKRKKPEDADSSSSEAKKIKLHAANGESETDPDSTSSPPKT